MERDADVVVVGAGPVGTALALDLGAEVISADRALINVCREMKLRAKDPTGGFKRQMKWVARCSGCGRRYGQDKAAETGNVCPVCGARIKRKVRR